MVVIATMYTAFGLPFSGAKTKIICLLKRGILDTIATFSVEVAGQLYKQAHRFLCLGGIVHHYALLSIEADRRIPNALCDIRKNILELYEWSSAPLKLSGYWKLKYSRRCCAGVPCAVHMCVNMIRCAELPTASYFAVSYDASMITPRRPCEDEEQKHQEDVVQEVGSVRGIRGAHGRHETVKRHDIRETLGWAGSVRGQKKECMRRLQEYSGLQVSRPTIGQLYLGHGWTAQNGERRGGNINGKMERDRPALWHSVICLNVTGRPRKRVPHHHRVRTHLLPTTDWPQWRKVVYFWGRCLLLHIWRCLFLDLFPLVTLDQC